MKICGLIHQFYPYIGGAEIETHSIYSAMTDKFDCSVHVVTSMEKGMNRKETFKENYTATYLPLTPKFCRLYSYPVMALLNSMLPGKGFDLYHGWFGVPGGVLATGFAKRKGKPSLVTAIGQDIYDPVIKHNFMVKKAVLRALRDADRVVALSNDIKKRVVQMVDKPIEVVNVGLNLDEYSDCFSRDEKDNVKRKYNTGDNYVITVCRLVKRKGLDYLINAMPSILKECPDTKFVLVGTGPEKKNLEALARRNGVSDNLIFTGRVSNKDLVILLREANLFTLPSLFEGLCNAYLEAMACETPIVATRCGGNEDSLTHNENSLLVPIQDSKKLSDAIIRVLTERRLSKSLVSNGNRVMRTRFDIRTAVRKYFKIYEELINTHNGK